MPVPDLRIRELNRKPANPDGEYVLYWMTAFRRTRYNFALERAVAWSHELHKPLVIFEALRSGYRWASDRLHHFAIQGMADNQRRLADRPATYYPYIEPEDGAGKGLLRALALKASVVVGDDFPSFFLPRMIRAAAPQIPVAFELVDANGILPLRAADKVFARAHDFRRFLQKNLAPHLEEFPKANPLARQRLPTLDRLPSDITKRWPTADCLALAEDATRMSEFPIDHAVAVTEAEGGERAALRTLRHFLKLKLSRYAAARNQPEENVTSGLSPYLHFGHISAHQVFQELMDWDGWSPDCLATKATGSRSGWWGASVPVEAFLDEFITWRELGHNMSWQWEDAYDRYESLPDWARTTLEEHDRDRRKHVYTLAQFAGARTHDPLWNAAQRQLTRDGRIHNYLRMLWGKKILEWTRSPRDALDIMTELNNRFALDGRNPNSVSGICWVLGRYDRPWGPERPIFGKVRYMSSENTARKVKVGEYLERYGEQ